MDKTMTAAIDPSVTLTAAQSAALTEHVGPSDLADESPIDGLITSVAVVRGGGVKVTRADLDEPVYYYRGREIRHERSQGDPWQGLRGSMEWTSGRLHADTLTGLRREIDARIGRTESK